MSTIPLRSADQPRDIVYRGIPINEPHSNVVNFNHPRKNSELPSLTLETAYQEHVCFPVTVDSDLSDEAQDILQHACGESIDAITYEPIPRKHQTKLRVHLKAAAYGIALHSLILGLPAAEFGTVIHITPHL